MKKNQKGFTLIELLAVIVILAVIALIATPLIMNVINNAKQGANRDAAYGVVKAVETSAMQKMALDPTYKLPASCTIDSSDPNNCVNGSDKLKVDYKGTKPIKAVIKFDANGTATEKTYVKMAEKEYYVMDASGVFPGTPQETEPAA